MGGAPAPTGVNHGDGPLRRAHFALVTGLCFAPDDPAGNTTTWAF